MEQTRVANTGPLRGITVVEMGIWVARRSCRTRSPVRSGPSRASAMPRRPSKSCRAPSCSATRRASIRRSGPGLGEHTEEVLLEHGRTWDDIAALNEQGTVR